MLLRLVIGILGPLLLGTFIFTISLYVYFPLFEGEKITINLYELKVAAYAFAGYFSLAFVFVGFQCIVYGLLMEFLVHKKVRSTRSKVILSMIFGGCAVLPTFFLILFTLPTGMIVGAIIAFVLDKHYRSHANEKIN